MINKHFFKLLFLFTGMIVFGLLGIFLVSSYGEKVPKTKAVESKTQVAK
jgi:hypothetical protein